MTSLVVSLSGGHPDFDSMYSGSKGQALAVKGVKSCKHRFDRLYLEFVNDEALEQAFKQCGWAKDIYIEKLNDKPVTTLKARLVPGSEQYDDAVYLHCQINGTHMFFSHWDIVAQ